MREVLEFFPGLACCCRDGVIDTINHMGGRMLGYDDPDDLTGLDFDALLSAEYRGADLVDHILETGVPTLAMMSHRDGGKTGVEIRVQWARELGPGTVIVRAEDVSDRMALSTDILSSEVRFRSLVDNTLDMICAIEQGEIKFINKAGLAMLQVPRSENVVGKSLSSLFHPDYREVFESEEALQALFVEETLFPTRLARFDGSYVDVHIALIPDAGNHGRIMLEVRDITEHRNAVMALHSLNKELEEKVMERTRDLAQENELRRKVEEKLRHMATHDNLTGLPNRRLLMDRIEGAFRRAHRQKKKVAVMFIDLDGFKEINDSHGHDIGDAVLKTVADRLRGLTRETDTVGRLGGDEFIVIYTDLEKASEVAALAKKINAELATPMPLPEVGEGRIGGSIGIALYPDHGETGEDVLNAADDMMYAVKNHGKNGFQLAGNISDS